MGKKQKGVGLRQPGFVPPHVVEQQKTARMSIRWGGITTSLNALFPSLAAVGVAWQLGGHHTQVDLGLYAGVSVLVPGLAWKVAYDRSEKRRMRERIEHLEKMNERLKQETRTLGAKPQSG
jgi:hypothetical protein